MKCSACEAQKCGRQYDDRLFCVGKKEKIECTCTCQVSATETAVTGLISAGLGIGLVAGGIALTLMSGGLFAIVAGSAAIGAGSSLVTNPIQKAFAGEHMTLKDTIVDTATGAVIGVASGGIGAYGSTLAKAGSGIFKLFVRMGTGFVAGAVSGFISELIRAIKGEKVSFKSFITAMGIGAAAGAIGGAFYHLSSNLTKGTMNGVMKATTRVCVQVGSTAATDAGIQFVQKGEIDVKQVLCSSTGALVLSVTSEYSQSFARKTDTFRNKTTNQIMEERILEKDESGSNSNQKHNDNLIGLVDNANNIPDSDFRDIKEVQQQKSVLNEIEKRENCIKSLAKIDSNKNLKPEIAEKKRATVYRINNVQEGTPISSIENDIKCLKEQVTLHKQVLETNAHALKGERVGQISFDTNPPKSGPRNPERLIMEKYYDYYYPVDYTETHDYDNSEKSVRNLINNPFDAQAPELINKKFVKKLALEENPEKRRKKRKISGSTPDYCRFPSIPKHEPGDSDQPHGSLRQRLLTAF